MFVRMGLVLALTGIVGGHAPSLSASELTLEQAVAQALARHPSLDAQAQSVRAAEHQAEPASDGVEFTAAIARIRGARRGPAAPLNAS